MVLGPDILDFLVEQLMQRTADSLWNKARSWVAGDAFSAELADVLARSLCQAVAHETGLPADHEACTRARDVILATEPTRLTADRLTPETPFALVVASAIAAQVAGARRRRDDLPGHGHVSSWGLLEQELGLTLDAPSLQRRWFEEFRTAVAISRLDGGALAPLASQLDVEEARLHGARTLHELVRLRSELSDVVALATSVEALERELEARATDEASAAALAADEVRSRLRARARQLAEDNPLVPQVRIVRRLTVRRSLAQVLLEGTGRMHLVAGPGEGKSVALADAAIHVMDATEDQVAVVLHWSEVRDLPRAVAAASFARTVAASLFPGEQALAEALGARLERTRCVVLVDGIDELGSEGPASRARLSRFCGALESWAATTGNGYVVASRTGADVPASLAGCQVLRFEALTPADVAGVVEARLGAERAEEARRRVEAARLHGTLLVLNLALMAMSTEPDDVVREVRASTVGELVPLVVDALVRGAWREDGSANEARVAEDLLDAASRAAWNLAGGRTVGRFSHRDLVRALGGDRATAYELEDRSNLIVGGTAGLHFVHRRVADHLLALHASRHPDQLEQIARERFWEHSLKHLLHDTAIVSPAPESVLGLAIRLRADNPSTFSLGLDYCVGVAASRSWSGATDDLARIRRDAYDACAARPLFARRHNAMWKDYVRDLGAFLQDGQVTATTPLSALPDVVARLLRGKGLASTGPAVESATREVSTYVRYLRFGTLEELGYDDTFAPTGSIIMPSPEARQEEFVTLWKDSGRTSPWRERKPSPGWLLCRSRPVECDLDGTDVCEGGWTNRYESSWFKPFGLRCAWVSAMARDRRFVQAYLSAHDLSAVVRATKFEWSRAHALVRLVVAHGEVGADDLRWWWDRSDTTAEEKDWVLEELAASIELDTVGRFLTEVPEFLSRPDVSARFEALEPSLVSGRWNEFWGSEQDEPGPASTGRVTPV